MCPRVAMLARLGLILCLVAGTRQLSITEFVVPEAVETGQDAELRCQYELSPEEAEASLMVKWWLTRDSDKTLLYQRIAPEPGGAVQHEVVTKDNDTIVLLKVLPGDSGIYECEVSHMPNVQEDRKHQELTVFTPGSGPQLNLSTVADGADEDEDEDVLIECEVSDVAPSPDIVLTVNGEEFNITESLMGPDEEGLFDVVGEVTLSKHIVDGAEVRCELFYTNHTFAHQPYVDTVVYDPSGALTTTEAPEDVTEPDPTPDSLPNLSAHSCHCQMSWAMLFLLALLTQISALL